MNGLTNLTGSILLGRFILSLDIRVIRHDIVLTQKAPGAAQKKMHEESLKTGLCEGYIKQSEPPVDSPVQEKPYALRRCPALRIIA